MEAGRSLRELFAELSRPGGGDPADLLRAAGFGDVPESLVAEAIVSYAATAPLEVAEHLAPFAVAHGPVPAPDPAVDTARPDGLALLASAPTVDVPGYDPAADRTAPVDPELHGDAADHAGTEYLGDDVDVDPSALDDPTADLASHEPAHHADVDPAGVDGLDQGSPHAGPGTEPHPVLGSFGVGHDADTPVEPDGPADQRTHDGGADDDVDPLLVRDHDQDLDPHGPGVNDHDPNGMAADSVMLPLDDDGRPDPADLLDGDEHHHL
jgi:hypothetical protein